MSFKHEIATEPLTSRVIWHTNRFTVIRIIPVFRGAARILGGTRFVEGINHSQFGPLRHRFRDCFQAESRQQPNGH